MINWFSQQGFFSPNRKLRILACPPNRGGCAYYRTINPNAKLAELYGNVVDLRFDENPLGLDATDNKNPKWIENWNFESMKWADVVFVNNIHKFGGPYTARIVGKAKEFGKIVHFDTDDLLTDLYDGHRLQAVYRDGGLSDITKFIYHHSDIVSVTQRKFVDRIKPFCSKLICVIKNSIDYNLPAWKTPKQPSKKIRIGWAAGIHHEEDVKEFSGVPSIVNQKVGREKIWWSFWGHPPPPRENPENKWQWEVWDNYKKHLLRGFKGQANWECQYAIDPDNYGVIFSMMDVAIAPLQMNSFNDSKSDIKVAECASRGIPLIASDVGCYDETIVNGETGYLLPANATKTQWANTLSKVLRDPEGIKRMGKNLYDRHRNVYDLNKVVHHRLDLYHEYFSRVGYQAV